MLVNADHTSMPTHSMNSSLCAIRKAEYNFTQKVSASGTVHMHFLPFPFKIRIATQRFGKLSRIALNYARRKVSANLEICHGHLHTDSIKFILVS